MSEAKPFASLSSGLLARKGAAKPAMRPQAFGQVAQPIEDLGWNDMGHMPAAPEPEAFEPAAFEASAPPPVVEQQRVLEESFEREEEPAAAPRAEPAPVIAMPIRPAIARKDKAAFTLRLDAERHFRLRLACAVTGRSAQQIVSVALDEMLRTIPEVEALAGHLPAGVASRS